MKRILKRIAPLDSALRYFDADGNPTDHGNLRGDVSGLTGNVSGLTGNVSGLTGDVDAAEISKKERKNGIKVKDLISE